MEDGEVGRSRKDWIEFSYVSHLPRGGEICSDQLLYWRICIDYQSITKLENMDVNII